MRLRIVMMLVTWLSGAVSVAGQGPDSDMLRALGLDSLDGPVLVFYSKGVSTGEAAEVQRFVQGCVAKYQDVISNIPPVTVAILDSAAWMRVSQAPYGIPNHNAAVTPALVIVPATAAALFSAGIPPEQAQRFFRLLALHELGHLLKFAAVGVDRTNISMATRWPIPGWYREFAAEYFRISCLPPNDAGLGASPEWLKSNRPTYTLFEEAERLHEKRNADGTPYMGTPAYWRNFSWLEHVVAEAARLQQRSLGAGFVALLREQWQRPSAPLTTQAVIEDLTRSNPDLVPWLRSVGAIQ
jgi:hypothetical protein